MSDLPLALAIWLVLDKCGEEREWKGLAHTRWAFFTSSQNTAMVLY